MDSIGVACVSSTATPSSLDLTTQSRENVCKFPLTKCESVYFECFCGEEERDTMVLYDTMRIAGVTGFIHLRNHREILDLHDV